MTEPDTPVRRVSRLAVVVLVCAVALTASTILASAPTQVRAAAERPLPVPGAFQLPASNGYTLLVVGIPSYANRPGSLEIFAYKKGESVSYRAPATVTEASIQADLGEVGEISVAFHRSGRAVSVPCGERPIRFDSGYYEGTIQFHGEQGYTTVEATRVPGSTDYWEAILCGEFSEVFSGAGGRGGALLYVRNPALGQEMSVSKRRPGAAAQIVAEVSEYTGSGIAIKRYATLRMPGEGFTYDRRLRTATVRPPAPFAGSARFDLREKAGRRWSGDLTVDLPGRADVPLTGPLLRATLVSA